MLRFRVSAILAAVGALLVPAFGAAQSTTVIPDGGVRIGIGPQGDPCREARLAHQAGFPWVGLGASWNSLEPTQGNYVDPAGLRTLLQCARSEGLSTQLVVTGAPAWASGYADPNHPPTTPNIPAYATFLGHLAQQVGPLVDVWTPWNEPNFDQQWAPPNDVGQYVAIQKAAYAAIKAVVPTTKVSAAPIVGTPNSSGVPAWDYLQAAYDAGLAGSADVILLNFYPRTPPEGTAVDSKGRPAPWALSSQPYMRGIVDKNDPSHPPIWITETSYATCQPCVNGAANQVTEAEQADYITRMYLYRRRYLQGVTDRIFWYELHNGGADAHDWYQNQGLYRWDWTAKPAVAALDAVRVLLPASSTPTDVSSPAVSVPTLPPAAATPPTPASGRTPAGVRTSLAKLRVRVSKGVITIATRAVFSSGGGRLRVEGYRNRKWRLVKTVRLPRTAKLTIRFADLGYLGVRVLVRPNTSKRWVASRVARLPKTA